MLFDRVAQTPHREAYRYPTDARWVSLTWEETGERVTRLAAGLLALGITAQQRVAIASATRFEWILADLAIMCAGAATTTVYPSAMSSDVMFILDDSESQVVFAENDDQIAKLRDQRDALSSVRAVVTFDGKPDQGDDPWVISLDGLGELGAAHLAEHPHAVEERIAAIAPEHLATLIYTSGTTGQPKGVRLRHSSWTYEGAATAALGLLDVEDLQYLWLPMAHAFGKVLLTTQLQVGFATAVDGRVDKIVDNLAVVQPTFMGAAPRIFEKAYGRVVSTARSAGFPRAMIFDWACAVGLAVSRLVRRGQPVPWYLAAAHELADRLVLGKVRDRFGGRLRFFISGSAALSQQVAEWFHAAGILILEGYGLTETSAGSVVNRPDRFKLGTVGLPLPGTELKIAGDGEVLLRGPGVMEGYHHLEAGSREVADDEGWLATGDIGEVDADGFLRITDRKKDLFKTSGGKYVAPSHVEGRFMAVCPLASQIVVHGNQRNFCVALIALDPDAVTAWADRHGMNGMSYAQVTGSPEMRASVESYVAELNSQLNRWETIKKFIILDHDLTVDSGELTPSMKVRRSVVETNYRKALDDLYPG
ncbi:MAG TPA: long-chain fatty acid--CoA ligase [Pseudonocardiaceae bacterium]